MDSYKFNCPNPKCPETELESPASFKSPSLTAPQCPYCNYQLSPEEATEFLIKSSSLPYRHAARGNGRVARVDREPLRKDPLTGSFSTRDIHTNRFTDLKRSGGSLKGVPRER